MEKETKEINEKIKKDNFYLKNYRWINISIIITITAIIVFSIKGFSPFLNQFGNAFKGKGFFEDYLGWVPEIKFLDRLKNFFTIEGFRSLFVPFLRIIISPMFIFFIPFIPLIIFAKKKRNFKEVKLETEEDIKEYYNKFLVKISLKIKGYYKIIKAYIALTFIYAWHFISLRDENGKLYIFKYGLYTTIIVLFFNGNLALIISDIFTLLKYYFSIFKGNINTEFFWGMFGFGKFALYFVLDLLTFWRVLFMLPFVLFYLIKKNADRKKAKQYKVFRKKISETPMVIHYIGEIQAGKTLLAIATIIAAELNKIDFFRKLMREIELRFKKVLNFKKFKDDFLEDFHKEKINTPIEAMDWSKNYVKNNDGKDLSEYTYNDYRDFGLVLKDQIALYGPAYYNLLLATRIHSNINVYNVDGFTNELKHYVKRYIEPRKDMFLTVGTEEEVQEKRRIIIDSILNDVPIPSSAKILNIDILRGNQVGDKKAYYFASFGGISTLVSEIDKENPSKNSDVTEHQKMHTQASTTRHEASIGPFNVAKHVEDSQNFNASEAQTRGAKGFMYEIVSRVHKRFFTIKLVHKFVEFLFNRTEDKIKLLKETRDDETLYLERLERRASLLLKFRDFLEQYDFFEYKLLMLDAYEGSPLKAMGLITYHISLDNYKYYNTTALNNYFISRARLTEIIERDVKHYSSLVTTPEEASLQNSKMNDEILKKVNIKVIDDKTGELVDYELKVKKRRYSKSEEKAYQEMILKEEKERIKKEKENNK